MSSSYVKTIRRAEEHDETDSEGSWAISYGDMITLLLTFFILFFNVNNKQSEQKEALQLSILTEFGKGRTPVDDLAKGKVPPMTKAGEQKDGALEEQILESWGGTIKRFGEKVVIEFPNTAFFAQGKIDLKEDAKPLLQKFAQKYIKYAGSNSLSIKAFTDSKPVIKNAHRFQDNLELSALRAIAAMRVLQHAGIPLDRMKIAGNGENYRKPGSTASSEEFSRKVILVIEPLTKEKI